jgi:sugar phosphate permease
MEAQRTRPSIGRWYILFLISLMYLITYLDRVNISTVAPVISKEFGFDKVTMGIIFSAFVWAYALFQVPGGWLNDRFGPRRVLAIIVAYWSVMTAATAAATGAVSFVIVRFLFGIGEGGAFPGATRAMQLWYPRHERGFCQGITHDVSWHHGRHRSCVGFDRRGPWFCHRQRRGTAPRRLSSPLWRTIAIRSFHRSGAKE